MPETISGADAAVLVRWTTNTVRAQQPTGSALSPSDGQTENYIQIEARLYSNVD